ncbi:MAG TPA: carbohydrate kinase family protein [Candidatus Acidoferrales bacterium]|nr:carbohydrate kinase family protein [Candidatus Acidoferrales bacterium]
MPQLARLSVVDVTGVGINATDTVIELSRFPDFNSKLEFSSARVFPGGQVASALVACRRWGLSARYIGSVGDDSAAALQRLELREHRIECHLIRLRNCLSQLSYILIDGRSGERTILWKRDSRLTLRPRHLRRRWIERSKVLLLDGHDAVAAAQAARWARAARIPVVADVDNLYPGVEALLECTDYLFASFEFPVRFLGNSDPFVNLPRISQRFGCKVTGVTLGHLGALAWDGARFHYCRGYRVRPVDTTGAGDIFHAGIVYGISKDWALDAILEFSCAAAALNCTALGARGGIKSLPEIRSFMRHARRSEPAFSQERLERTASNQSRHS